MSLNDTLRRTEPPRGKWVDFDSTYPSRAPLCFDRTLAEAERHASDKEAQALEAEARHTGMLIAVGLPAGVLLTWIIDFVAGGPGLGAMFGL